MAFTSAESRSARARLAHNVRRFGDNSSQAQDARRDFAAARIEDHIRGLVESAPPLTDEQRERIAGLLRVNPARPQQDHADLGLVDSPEVGGDV